MGGVFNGGVGPSTPYLQTERHWLGSESDDTEYQLEKCCRRLQKHAGST